MKELTDYINANKNDADEINKILQLQNRIVNWNPVIFLSIFDIFMFFTELNFYVNFIELIMIRDNNW
jgi:hypothetical protein